MGAAKTKKLNGNYPAKTAKVVPLKPALPHYTAESVIALFESGDPRIQTNPYGTEPSIQLSDVAGYFKYSDEKGGIATFYNGDTKKPVFTVAREITDELRNAKCDYHGDDCECDTTPWNQLNYSCGCSQHHEGDIYNVIPRLELCNKTECDGKHAHLLALCEECYSLDELDGVPARDITADNVRFQIV